MLETLMQAWVDQYDAVSAHCGSYKAMDFAATYSNLGHQWVRNFTLNVFFVWWSVLGGQVDLHAQLLIHFVEVIRNRLEWIWFCCETWRRCCQHWSQLSSRRQYIDPCDDDSFGAVAQRVGIWPLVHVVVIESRGEFFCAGRGGNGESRVGMSAYDIRVKMMGAVLGVYKAIAQVPVLVIAMVQGDAVGFGAALAEACDLTLASSQARFPSLKSCTTSCPPWPCARLWVKFSAKRCRFLFIQPKVWAQEKPLLWGSLARSLIKKAFAKTPMLLPRACQSVLAWCSRRSSFIKKKRPS